MRLGIYMVGPRLVSLLASLVALLLDGSQRVY